MKKCNVPFSFLVALLASVFLIQFSRADLPQEVQVARPWFPDYNPNNLMCPFLLDPQAQKLDSSKKPQVLAWLATALPSSKSKQKIEGYRQPLIEESSKAVHSDPELFSYGHESPSDYFKNPQVLKNIRKTDAMKFFLQEYPKVKSDMLKSRWLSEAFHHLLTELIDNDDKLFAHQVQLSSWLHVFGSIAYSSLELKLMEPKITMIYGLYTVALYSQAANHAGATRFAMGLADSLKHLARELSLKGKGRLQGIWQQYLFVNSRPRSEFPLTINEQLLQDSRKALPPTLANRLPTTERKSPHRSADIQSMLEPVFDPKRRASAYTRIVEAFQYSRWCFDNSQFAVKSNIFLLEHEMPMFYRSRDDFDWETLRWNHY